MKYKAEVVYGKKVVKQFYFSNLTHPNQVVRNVVSATKSSLNYFIIFVVNEFGEVWQYSVMKDREGRFKVRRMQQGKRIFNKNEIDLIFTDNMDIMRGFYEN